MSALRQLVEKFEAYLRDERRYSSHTLSAYQRDLDALCHWLDQQSIKQWRDLSNEQLRQASAQFHREGLGAKSLQRRLSAYRSFFAWLIKHGELKASPADGVRAPKAPRKLPQVLDVDEMQALVEVPTDTTIGKRDRAMLELFYSSGLRLSELCALRWPAVDINDGLVRVDGKGGKTRIVPLGSHAKNALTEWRSESTPKHDAPVFPGRGGAPITPRAVQIRLRQIAQQQGLFKRVHPHLIRHSFASHILESSGDLRGVQELLGHADIATTQIYTHLDYQHLAKVYDAAHPRAKRKRS
jgi:integrase/recombinase XerC